MEMTEAFRIFVYMSYVYVYYAVSSRPYYKQQWGKRRQTRQRKKDMAVILNNPLSKLIISRGNHHTFLRHALNNPKCVKVAAHNALFTLIGLVVPLISR